MGKEDQHFSRDVSHDIKWWEAATKLASDDRRRYLPNRHGTNQESGVYPLDGILLYRELNVRQARIELVKLCQMRTAAYNEKVAPLRRKYDRHFRRALEAASVRLGTNPKGRRQVLQALDDWTADVDLAEFQEALNHAVEVGGHRLLMGPYKPRL